MHTAINAAVEQPMKKSCYLCFRDEVGMGDKGALKDVLKDTDIFLCSQLFHGLRPQHFMMRLLMWTGKWAMHRESHAGL